MSKAAAHKGGEHLLMAAQHLETAAKQHRDAAKLFNAGNEEKAGHHVLVAGGEFALAQDHVKEASMLHAAEYRK